MSITSIHDVTDEWIGRHVRVTRLDDGATNTGVIRHVRRTDEYTSVDLTQPDGETWWGALVVYRPGAIADWERAFGMDDLAWTVERLPDLPGRPSVPAPARPMPDLRETHE